MRMHDIVRQPARPVIRVMVVDDSIVARAILVRSLQGEPDIAVVAEAASGRAALAALHGREIDLVLLDLEMPDMGGLQVLPALIGNPRGPKVLVVSSACGSGAQASLEALRLGAADTLLKPLAGRLSGSFERDLVDKVRRIIDDPAQFATCPPAVPPAPVATTTHRTGAKAIDCIAIGASTGGVHALTAFFSALPAAVRTPILVTQHLPVPFMPYFAGQLQEMSGRPTRLAADGIPVEPGTILLAPGDAHLGLARTRGTVHVRLERRAMPSGCTPSVDPMLAAVARIYGASGLAIILSGMGRDGVIGAAELAGSGGEILAQDADSSVVWGMPGAVATSGLAALVLSPAALAVEVGRRCAMERQPAWT